MLARRDFLATALAAAATPVTAAAAAADIVVPLHLSNNTLTAPVWLDGKGPYPFLMSTGQLTTLVSAALAQSLGLKAPNIQPGVVMSEGGPVKTRVYTVEVMNLSGWKLRKPALWSDASIPLDGEIAGAFPFIARGMTSFDFDVPEMRVHATRIAPPEGAAKEDLIQRSGGDRRTRQAAMIYAPLGENRLKLLLNTGNPHALTLTPDAVRRLNLWSGAAAPDSAMQTITAHSFDFGGKNFADIPVRLRSPALARAEVVDWDGVVGMEVLRRFRVLFDPDKAAVWLTPNAHLTERWRT